MLTALRRSALPALFCLATVLSAGSGAANPLEPGWTLKPEMSNLRFQSVKNTTKVESSSFATFTGEIGPDGAAEVTVLLDSVDTKIDIRNVRMRFLFFETFNYPQATITTRIDPEQVTQLATSRRMSLQLPFSLDLHGVKKTFIADVVATLLSDDLVSVASATPISIAVAEFGLMENLGKLQEAAGGVSIIPSATVSFDFIFARNAGAAAAPAVAQAPAATATPANVALEEQGDFSREACEGRFETMSRVGGVFFRSGSTRIDERSAGALRTVAEILQRCPGLVLEVGGHTDSDGGTAANQRLSEARARSVANYLVAQGIEADRLVSRGYGETQPMVPNTTAANKGRNRRIEFSVVR